MKKRKEKRFFHWLYLLKTTFIHPCIELNHWLPPPCLANVFPVARWIRFLYLPFCGCCLTPSTKLNTRSGCPLYNLASNSKDFPESLAKLLGMIFLYFGTLLTCCRYLFSSFKWYYHTQCALSWTICWSRIVNGVSVLAWLSVLHIYMLHIFSQFEMSPFFAKN